MKTMQRLGGLAAALVLGWSAGTVSADEAAVRASLGKLLPDLKLDSVQASPVPGLYEVVIGARLFYISDDGNFLIQGSVIDTRTRKNITEAKMDAVRKDALAEVEESDMVIFSPEDPKHTITVFTDLDCGYCRKLHKEIGDYMDEGIRVRYLMFPRAGIGSPSYHKAVSVWCADDRNQALTDAKSGKDPTPKTCDNPVAEQMHLGESMGVTGTPAVILEDGELLPGYVPAKRMSAFLEAHGGK
jgi:thiol:disulfide interchange protein DsbC